jgi:hypothetical protein
MLWFDLLDGQLTPLYIDDDEARYYFFNTIDGLSFTFVVTFGVENGVWKIVNF